MLPVEVTIFLAVFSILAGGLIGWVVTAHYHRKSSKRQKAEIKNLRKQLNEAHQEQVRLQKLNLRMQELISHGSEVSVVRDHGGSPDHLSVSDTFTDTLVVSSTAEAHGKSDVKGLAQGLEVPPEGIQTAITPKSGTLEQAHPPDDVSQPSTLDTAGTPPRPTYQLKLHQTYYDQGFFNLGVAVDRFIRSENGPITICLGNQSNELQGKVNRDANQNGTPRIMGGAELRNWFQRNFSLGETVDVVVLAPDKLLIARYVSSSETS